MNKIAILLAVLALAFTGCDTENELRKSVFVEDPDADGLPLYSEWGYNTFGVYFDRAPFTSNVVDAPGKFIIQDGVTVFSLLGDVTGNPEHLTLSFVLPDAQLEELLDILTLHDTTLDLVAAGVSVMIKDGDQIIDAQVLEGELTFKRAQRLLVDKQEAGVILSGTFDLKVNLNGVPTSLSEGRFDLRFTEDNFFVL